MAKKGDIIVPLIAVGTLGVVGAIALSKKASAQPVPSPVNSGIPPSPTPAPSPSPQPAPYVCPYPSPPLPLKSGTVGSEVYDGEVCINNVPNSQYHVTYPNGASSVYYSPG